MAKSKCIFCGEFYIHANDHPCFQAKPKRGLPTTSGPPERKPEKPQIQPRPKITPLTVGDNRVIPLTVDKSKVTPLTAEVEFTKPERPKWKGPLSTERVRKYRELHGEDAKKSHAAYMRRYRKYGPKGTSGHE